MTPRQASKVDANQSHIVDALQRVGASVMLLHRVGRGCPDLLVGWHGVNILMEVKDGSRVPSARKLTPAQVVFHNEWRGQVCIVTDVDSALRVLGLKEED